MRCGGECVLPSPLKPLVKSAQSAPGSPAPGSSLTVDTLARSASLLSPSSISTRGCRPPKCGGAHNQAMVRNWGFGIREFGRNDFFLEPGYIFSYFWARQLARFLGGFLVFKGHNSKVAEAFSQLIHRYQEKELI